MIKILKKPLIENVTGSVVVENEIDEKWGNSDIFGETLPRNYAYLDGLGFDETDNNIEFVSQDDDFGFVSKQDSFNFTISVDKPCDCWIEFLTPTQIEENGEFLTIHKVYIENDINIIANALNENSLVHLNRIYFQEIFEIEELQNCEIEKESSLIFGDVPLDTLSAEAIGEDIDLNDVELIRVYNKNFCVEDFVPDGIKKTSNESWQIKGLSFVSVLDDLKYNGGVFPQFVLVDGDVYWVEETYGRLCERLSQKINIEIPKELKKKNVKGFLKSGTYRECLAQIMFALQLNLKYDVYRKQINLTNEYNSYNLFNTDDETTILGDIVIEKNDKSKGITLTNSLYTSSFKNAAGQTLEFEEVFTGNVTKGQIVYFSKPYLAYKIEQSNIVEKFTPTYVEFKKDAENISFMASPYTESNISAIIGDGSEEIKDYTLIDYSIAKKMANKLLNMSNDTVNATIICDAELGDELIFETAFEGKHKGFVYKIKTDYSDDVETVQEVSIGDVVSV